MAHEDIAALTPRRAASIYLEATKRLSPKTGTVLSSASHRGELSTAKSFYRWATQRGHVGASPFRDVKPVGKVRAGKPQLRIEEARRFTSAAVSCFEETRHPLAIGVLLARTMGLRTSEVMQRVARDLDDGGRCLWIDSGKTANARRRLDVPRLAPQSFRNRSHRVSAAALSDGRCQTGHAAREGPDRERNPKYRSAAGRSACESRTSVRNGVRRWTCRGGTAPGLGLGHRPSLQTGELGPVHVSRMASLSGLRRSLCRQLYVKLASASERRCLLRRRFGSDAAVLPSAADAIPKAAHRVTSRREPPKVR